MLPRRVLGATGLDVSVLGFGGATIGFSDAGDAEAFVEVVRQAVRGGITFFDTAPDYRLSEEILGDALADVDPASFVLATKVGRTQSLVGGAWQAIEDWGEVAIRRSIEESLRRLRVERVDLVQLHSPPLRVIAEGAARATLERIRADGLAGHIGLSADGEEARLAIASGGFETLQLSASILQQEPLALAAEAAGRGLGVIAKQPLANGIPTLLERPGHPDWARKWEVAERLDWAAYRATGDEPGDRRARLDIALRFMLAQPAIATSIVGTTSARHLAANLAAAAAGPVDQALARRIEGDYGDASAGLSPTQP